MMKLIFVLSLLFTSQVSVVTAQVTGSGVSNSNTGTNINNIDPALLRNLPNDGINYLACFADLNKADVNHNGEISANEYLGFVELYSKSICHYTDRLTLQQRSAFNTLACRCREQPGANPNCCLGNNAQISTAGAASASRTQAQLSYLIAVCRITDATIPQPRGCPPDSIPPNQPPPFVFTPAVPPPAAGGLSPGALAGIIIGAILGFLLLLLCCFCCLCAGRRKKQGEEEEEQKVVEEDIEQAPEQSPAAGERAMEVPPQAQDRAMAVPPMGSAAPPLVVPPPPGQHPEDEIIEEYVEEEDGEGGRGGQNTESELDDEEVRKGRGSAKIPPEVNEPKRRIIGAGEIPDDPKNPERVILRPIDKEQEENPDWDFPGQAVNYPTEKDEMSAGEVEHYEPDGGVYIPERPAKEPLDWRKDWQKPDVEDPDEYDNRKHRIQAGLGEGEVWDQLNNQEEPDRQQKDTGDVFDWVVQSALGVLSETEKAGHLDKPAGSP